MSFDRFWLRQCVSSGAGISWKETKYTSHEEIQLLENLKIWGGGGMKPGCIPSRLIIKRKKKSRYFAGTRDFHQSADTDGERKTGSSRFFELAAQTDEHAATVSTHLLNQPGPGRRWRGERGRTGGRSQYNDTLL